MIGYRYREWKRTGGLPELPKAGVWAIVGAAAFCLLVWWLCR
jgi:hypothetical protein